MGLSQNSAIQVLIIDDLQIARVAATHLFTKLKCKVDVVANAAEALQQLVRAHYDIIFIDIHLPDLNGLSLAQTIRSIENRWSRIPLVAFTANNDPSLKKKSKSYGFDDFLLKPLTPESVKKILLKHLSKRKIMQSKLDAM